MIITRQSLSDGLIVFTAYCTIQPLFYEKVCAWQFTNLVAGFPLLGTRLVIYCATPTSE